MKTPERKRRVMGRTQVELLEQHLRAGRSISPAEAQLVYGMARLAARVLDLKTRKRLKIKRTIRVDAKGQKYARYYL